eukprot:scaffold4707_cov96-Skeletonema_dohrnii-CCMP3373.AAC.12
MANYNEPLEAVDCHTDRVRTIWYLRVVLAAILYSASSGHLRRISEAAKQAQTMSTGTYSSIT